MDLSHLPFLHRDTFNFPASYARIPAQVETDRRNFMVGTMHRSAAEISYYPA
jgi:hypothetical protein